MTGGGLWSSEADVGKKVEKTGKVRSFYKYG